MNALFYVSLVRSYVYSNYRNYSGSIKLNVHDNLVLSAQLETGQIQGTCSLIDQSEQPVVQIIFKNNIPHGAYTEYWPNGKIKEKGMFELGLKEGEWLNYFSDGKPMAERNYAADG
jgi:antitoxin component YwqK of YwqJK toxin-antitoxin module